MGEAQAAGVAQEGHQVRLTWEARGLVRWVAGLLSWRNLCLRVQLPAPFRVRASRPVWDLRSLGLPCSDAGQVLTLNLLPLLRTGH